jgi:S1-C subfamily serine protease
VEAEGTGWVFRPGYVATNAHVVAGADTNGVVIQSGRGGVPAEVVLFDPRNDVAVLYAPGLAAPPLRIELATPQPGTTGEVIGFPGDGPQTAVGGVITSVDRVQTPDIYNAAYVTRLLELVNSHIAPGSSGSPLVAADGGVEGMTFGEISSQGSTTPKIPAFMAMSQIDGDLSQGATATTPVSTGACIAD